MASTGGNEEEAPGWVPLTSSKMSGWPVGGSGFGAGRVGVAGVEEAGLRASSRGPRLNSKPLSTFASEENSIVIGREEPQAR